jgi:hypothetical protein
MSRYERLDIAPVTFISFKDYWPQSTFFEMRKSSRFEVVDQGSLIFIRARFKGSGNQAYPFAEESCKVDI